MHVVNVKKSRSNIKMFKLKQQQQKLTECSRYNHMVSSADATNKTHFGDNIGIIKKFIIESWFFFKSWAQDKKIHFHFHFLGQLKVLWAGDIATMTVPTAIAVAVTQQTRIWIIILSTRVIHTLFFFLACLLVVQNRHVHCVSQSISPFTIFFLILFLHVFTISTFDICEKIEHLFLDAK